jgi:hypothetical protein
MVDSTFLAEFRHGPPLTGSTPLSANWLWFEKQPYHGPAVLSIVIHAKALIMIEKKDGGLRWPWKRSVP